MNRSVLSKWGTVPTTRRSISDFGITALTYLIVIGSLTPLLWLASTALKTRADAFAMPPKLFFEPTMDNFRKAFSSAAFTSGYLNSVIIALSTTFVALVLGVAAGYALSHPQRGLGRFMGRWIILARMAPAISFAVPIFVFFGWLNLLNTRTGLVLIYLTITLPFVTWLMIGFFKDLPPELEESARLDGCSKVQALVLILLPAVKSGLSTCAIFAFIMSWNEFFYALIISGPRTRPVSVQIQGFISSAGTDWGGLAAAALLVALPVLLFTLFAQKGLLRGLTAGSLK